METYNDLYNLNHINLAVGTLKEKLEKEGFKIWVGFNANRYYILDRNSLEQFIHNYQLDDDDLIEEIF
jgi:hypothetical protein